MRNQHLTPAQMTYVQRCRPLHSLIGHAASGTALALLFVGLLYCVDSTLARLLREVGGVTAFGALFLLHAALFACASLATATGRSVDCGGGAAVGSEGRRLAVQPARRQRSARAG